MPMFSNRTIDHFCAARACTTSPSTPSSSGTAHCTIVCSDKPAIIFAGGGEGVARCRKASRLAC
eukprot:2868783-Prymnesium_polylepis.1